MALSLDGRIREDMLMHILISSGCFSFRVTTMGDIHGVGPFTFSMIPALSSFLSSSSTLGEIRCADVVVPWAVSICQYSPYLFVFQTSYPFEQVFEFFQDDFQSSGVCA